MPPDKTLTDREIADLVRWVRMGAPYPADRPVTKTDVKPADFWSFQPPSDPSIPTVKNTAWPQSPLDHFVLAQLEAKGLKPAARADAHTLLRRASFDLTGLPASATLSQEDIDAFLADSSPKSFAKIG